MSTCKDIYKAKRISEKLARVISNSLTVSELKIYNKAEAADNVSFDAIYLSVLKNKYGFTAKQLKEILKEVIEVSEELKDFSFSGDYIPQVEELKDFGVDIPNLLKEAI